MPAKGGRIKPPKAVLVRGFKWVFGFKTKLAKTPFTGL
jgi:hypothetical protein